MNFRSNFCSLYITVFALIISTTLFSCGKKVEVPTAHTGKIMGKNGYLGDYKPTSRFRLDPCLVHCDRLVVLNVGDQAVTERMELFMPKDKLKMNFDLRMTLAVPPKGYDMFYTKVPPKPSNVENTYIIDRQQAYNTYAKPIIRTVAREFLSTYTIAEIASNREAVNSQLSEILTTAINDKTPFQVRYAGLADVKYPDIITTAQENAAARREQIQQEEAQLEISKVSLTRELKEAQLQRAIDVEKAEATREINKIIGDSVTVGYTKFKQLEALENLSKSGNNTFIPFGMLDSYATQRMITR